METDFTVPSVSLSGEITMFSGDISIFPTPTHALCDGLNGTPDLRGQFVRGWSDAVGQEYSGSVARRNDTQSEDFTTHSHGITRDLDSSIGGGAEFASNAGISNFQQAITLNTAGAGGGNETRPKNYALAFIMKI